VHPAAAHLQERFPGEGLAGLDGGWPFSGIQHGQDVLSSSILHSFRYPSDNTFR
jgi:hypothetical protein